MKKKLLYLVIIIVLIAFLAPTIYFYNQYQKTQQLLANPQDRAKQDLNNLINAVGKLVLLPKNETPEIQTISDKTKENKFFEKQVENGDKVLIYSKSDRVFLYRPGINKVVDIASVGAKQTETKTTPAVTEKITPTPSTKAKNITIIVLNGTGTSGLASSAKQKITGKITGVESIAVGDTVENYAKTLIVNPSLDKQVDNQLVAILGGSVVKAMPDGEKTWKQDIVIILGSDYEE